MDALSSRSYQVAALARSWEEIWEAGSYYERVAELLEGARRYAVIVGWQVDSRLPFRYPFPETLREKVLRLCETRPGFLVFFLMWDHAYFYVFERETMQARVWDDLHPRVHFVFDNRHPYGGSHHEKIVIIDGRVALVGGIDLCDERWDTPEHLYRDPRRSLTGRGEHHGPYHDLAVQVTGPVVPAIQRHVETRWSKLTSIALPAPSRDEDAGDRDAHRVYLSRTLAAVDHGAHGQPPVIREIEFLTRELVRRAERRIYLEGQYYWSRGFNSALISKLRAMRGADFEVVVVLTELSELNSLTRQMAYHELALLAGLQDAASASGARLLVARPFAHAPDQSPRPVYVHSKVMLVDDSYLSIGSANFANRAFRLDTELNLTLEARTEAEREHLRAFGERVARHWNTERDPARHLRLRSFRPRVQLAHERRRHPWLARFPWDAFFDPPMPWLYPLKRRVRRWERRQGFVALALVLVGAAAAFFAAGLAELIEPLTPRARVYAVALSTVWCLRVPFVPLTLIAALDAGPRLAAAAATGALWAASLVGYCLARAFPTAAERHYGSHGLGGLRERPRVRSFRALVELLADPRVPMRAKIAYQGLACVPFPWFALGTLVVLPSALATACWAIGRFR
jgi:phosphatidylserine/phosphatidylglycerophosphate/cardiolipin synthase-like enzyme